MAEARTTGSLPVANVQELAEACNGAADGGQVPERYLSKDPSSEEVVAGDGISIPGIDFQRLLDPQSSDEECAKLASACQHWSFFQLINHGVPDGVIRSLMNDVVQFFRLPLQDKKKESPQQPDSLEGYGQAFVVSDDDWAVDSIDAYCTEARELAYRLLDFMAKGVGAEPASLRGVFQGQPQGMRVNYYPPCRRAADRVVGLSPHTDPAGLTLLLQMSSDGVRRLQVRKDGKWFAVDAMDGAFVVNVGDALEILSNGQLRSVEHGAVIHPTKGRISAALFHYPCQDMILCPLPELVKKGDSVRYRSIHNQDFMKHYFTTKLDGRKHLERLLEQELSQGGEHSKDK